MRLKEAKTCCAFCWSPASIPSAMLASGSVAGAMDDDFNSEAFLEIRTVDLSDMSTTEMTVVARTLMPDRVHRIDWSPHGGQFGIIAGAFTDGTFMVWSVDTMLANGVSGTEECGSPILCHANAHNSAIRGLQFNPIQPHFLATGGVDRELYIWSLENPSSPQAVPALAKSTHMSEITDLRWNPKFAHILATATSGGVVTVWDLKAKRAALSFNVSPTQQGGANAIAWHPEISTHIAVARDDAHPVIQLWDLKKAMAPIRELRGHTQGITGLSWCAEDPSLLISCGCDGRTVCWNPLTGDLLGELPKQDNWIYDVQWSPRITAVLATASFDSRLSVLTAQDVSGGAASRAAPKWLRRPASAAFGFGGVIAAASSKDALTKVRITNINRPVAVEGSDRAFRESMAGLQNPSGAARAEWLRSQGYEAMAAATESAEGGNRIPFLHFLGADATNAEAEAQAVATPFDLEEHAYEDIISRCLVSGSISAAVDTAIAASRFDDAFALAHLRGVQETARVHAAYCEHLSRKPNTLRFIHYAGAVATGNFETVTSSDLPWKESLALLATYASGENFPEACNRLGSTLQSKGNSEGASTAFICSGNIDAVAQLWSAQLSPQQLVQRVSVLEQSLRRACAAPAFASALSVHAGVLANEGDFEGALFYSSRAAQLGDAASAIVADRIQYHVPNCPVRVQFPFAMSPIPDATSVECQMMASQQHWQRAPSGGAPMPAPAVATAVASRQLHQDPHAGQQQLHHQSTTNGGLQQRSYQQQQQQQAVGYQQATVQQQNYHVQAPAQSSQQQYASQPPPQQHVQPPPPQHTQPQQQPQHAPPAQPHYAQPQLTQPQPLPQPPPQPQPPQNVQPAPAPAPQQLTAPPPAVLRPVAPVAAAAPARVAAAPAALPPSSIASFDVGAIGNPTQRAVAANVIAHTGRVTDKRKRDAIEKAALELFDRFGKGLISDSVTAMLNEFVSSIGTPGSKENWRRLSDEHFDAVQPFLNLKFL